MILFVHDKIFYIVRVSMKKLLRILGISICTILVLIYLSFLFVLPNVINLNKYKDNLIAIVKEQTQLNLKYDNLKLITTPLLAVGIKADNVELTMSDNSLLFSSDNIKTAVSLPSFLLLQLKFSVAEIKKPLLNAEILKNGEDYKIVKLMENIINDNKETTFAQKSVETKNSAFDFSSLKIVIPKLILKEYKVLITDTDSKHYLDLHGNNLILGYYEGNRLKIKTNSELFSDENKNLQINIDLNTFLPQAAPKLDSEDDPAEKVDFDFINPVKTYRNYDLKGDFDAKIKINQGKDSQINSFGYVNAENLTMKVSKVQIPESYIRLKFSGTNIETDTDLYTHENENLRVNGIFNNLGAYLKIKTEQIKLGNLLELLKAFADSLQIQNEFNRYKAEGIITADCSIKTNYKKLNSQGFIKIENGGLSVKNFGEILSKMNINLIFDDNVLTIGNSEFYIGNSPVKINGLIDKKSFADINAKADNIPLPLLFNAFAPKQYKNLYNFKSGNLSSAFSLKGKMKEAVFNADLSLNNFYLTDNLKSIEIKNKLFNSKINYDVKNQKLKTNITNDDLILLYSNTVSNIKIPKISADITEDNIEIYKNSIFFNDKSKILYSGSITNYTNPQNIDLKMSGEINTNDLIKFFGSETKQFFNAKGNIPIDIKFMGNHLKQTLYAQLKADKDNYITPVNFTRLQNLASSVQTTLVFKPNRIKIKDTGFYTRAVVLDENNKEIVYKNKIAGVEGTIEGNTVNLLKIDIPQKLEGKFSVFPKSTFNIENGILYIYGKTIRPLIKGTFSVKDIIIPEISTNINSIDLNFKKDELHFNLNKLMLLSSDIDIKGKLNLLSSKIYEISDFIINSNNFNVEDTIKVSEKLSAYTVKSPAGKAESKQQGIPVLIHNGNIYMKKIKTGNIDLKNTKANLYLVNNILAVKKLSTNVFNGKTSGDIFINPVTMLINTDLKGNGIDTAKMLADSAGLYDSLSGTASYSAKLQINGAAKNNEEQIKGITGDIDFVVTDGQFGPFGRLENLILAENIRESEFFKTALGGIIDSLATIDTTHFALLKGHLSLKDGICDINPLTSLGNVMNLYIFGKFDIIRNFADMKVRVKLTSIISDMLGPISAINPVNLINNAAGLNVVTAKAFSLFCETISEEETDLIPKFSNNYVDNSASKFQLGVRGDASKPLTLIKSFKWLATQMQFARAKEFADSLPEPEDKNETIDIELQQYQKQEPDKEKIKSKFKRVFRKNKNNNSANC